LYIIILLPMLKYHCPSLQPLSIDVHYNGSRCIMLPASLSHHSCNSVTGTRSGSLHVLNTVLFWFREQDLDDESANCDGFNYASFIRCLTQCIATHPMIQIVLVTSAHLVWHRLHRCIYLLVAVCVRACMRVCTFKVLCEVCLL
jgi:hypothetical protein